MGILDELDAPDADGYVPLNVAADLIPQQTQYFCRYLTGWELPRGSTTLDEGIRWHDREASGGNYHAIRIHQDDVRVFAQRVLDHYISIGAFSPRELLK